MTRDEHEEALIRWLKTEWPAWEASQLDIKERDLSEALYAFSECSLMLSDFNVKDTEVAIRIWAIVEQVRRNGFPENLRM